ncbi:MAG TPA: DUF4097 family beta strand repeat-containing protein [Candidatus Elarobacter sp.]|nr:DUF4097 family beta strand repeat-containing protein [Candidatus Elarobacter sp.]
MLSRSTLIGALVVVELAIVGLAAKALGGGPPSGAFGLSFPSFGGHAVATTTQLNRTFVAGLAPHVVIDVHDIDVVVETANAPAVRGVETVTKTGYTSGTVPELTAQQTPDGVRFHTTASADTVTLGEFDRTLHVTVPAAALVEISSAGRVDASGLRAKLVAHSPGGPIYVSDHRGDLDLSSSGGRIVLSNVQGGDIAASTHDGRLLFRRVGAERLDASSVDNYIEAVDLYAVDGALTTHSGHVDVSFTGDSDATVSARTDDGKVHVHGLATTDDSRSSSVIHLGSGRGHFEVSTADGPVNITRGANSHA